jgi:hypothetical protein
MSDTKHNAPSSRACPSCGVVRSASAFRSSHPRTHCDECHASKASASQAAHKEPEGDVDPARGEAASSDAAVRTEETSSGELTGHKVAFSSGVSSEEPDPRRDDSRRRRLMRHGVDADRCAVLGIELDVGPRAPTYAHPAQVGFFTRGVHHTVWVSRVGAQIVEACLSPEALEHAAAFLRDVREEG